AAGRREYRGVDADHLAAEVERRPAGVAAVDRRVELDEVIVRSGTDIATTGRHDAGGDAAAEAEWVADRYHPVADTRRLFGEPDIRQLVVGIDLQQCKVGLWIGADDLGRVFTTIDERNLDLLTVVDDVVVGHDVAVLGDHETRPLRHLLSLTRGAEPGTVRLVAELFEEVVEGAVLGERIVELVEVERRPLV